MEQFLMNGKWCSAILFTFFLRDDLHFVGTEDLLVYEELRVQVGPLTGNQSLIAVLLYIRQRYVVIYMPIY
jgi:hypothetical protein